MSLISESQALAADLFGIAGELGALEHAVSITVPGSSTQAATTGIVQRSAEAVTTFTTAQVKAVSIERAAKSGGALEEGDLIINQVPRSSTNDPLVIRPDAIWTVTGPGITGAGSFRLRQAKPELLQWVITVRRSGK